MNTGFRSIQTGGQVAGHRAGAGSVMGARQGSVGSGQSGRSSGAVAGPADPSRDNKAGSGAPWWPSWVIAHAPDQVVSKTLAEMSQGGCASHLANRVHPPPTGRQRTYRNRDKKRHFIPTHGVSEKEKGSEENEEPGGERTPSRRKTPQPSWGPVHNRSVGDAFLSRRQNS